MFKVEDFLTAQQEQALVHAIRIAEKNTEKPPMERALEVFYFLKMDETELRNGVLIYVAVESKKFAILGDKGINDKVPVNFWDMEKEIILSHFSKNKNSIGLEKAILQVGEKLKEFFPFHHSTDTNELSDEISKG